MAAKAIAGVRYIHSRSCVDHENCNEKCNKDSDAPWQAEVYSKADGKKIRKRFTDKTAAKGWRLDAAKLVKDRKLRAPQPTTLRQEVDAWLAGARSGAILTRREQPYKPSTVRGYELALRRRVLDELGDKRLDAIDLRDLLELKEWMQGEGMEGGTIRNAFVPLQAIYRRARLAGRVAIDPTIDLPLPTSGVRDRDAATPLQAAALLEPLTGPEAGLFATAFYGGLRLGELRALRVRNVDLDAQTIRVEHGWDPKDGQIDPKSVAGTRTVFAADTLVPYLQPLVDGRDPDAFVFGHLAGDTPVPFEPRAIIRKAERAWKATDKKRAEEELNPLVRFTPQEARAAFRTWLDATTIGDTRADKYHGHANSHVRGRYVKPSPSQLAADRQTFDAYVSGVAAGKLVALAG